MMNGGRVHSTSQLASYENNSTPTIGGQVFGESGFCWGCILYNQDKGGTVPLGPRSMRFVVTGEFEAVSFRATRG